MAQNVIFKFGTLAAYNQLDTKDINTLYWLTDVQRLYKGDMLFGTGSEASETAAGLLSAEDYKKLQELINSGASTLTPMDASIILTDGNIGVQLSKVEGNGLSLKGDGLYAISPEPVVIPEYTLEKQAVPTIGSAATYKLKKTVGEEVSYVGSPIELSKDIMLQKGSMEIVAEADVPYDGAQVGDPYIKLVLNDAGETTIYVPCKDLVDTVSAGVGIEVVDNTVGVKLSAVDRNVLITAADGGLYVEDCGFTDIDRATIDAIPEVYATKEEMEEKIESMSNRMCWEELPVSVSSEEAVAAIHDAADNAVISVSSGVIDQAIAVDNSVTLMGANSGIAQNHSQEVL